MKRFLTITAVTISFILGASRYNQADAQPGVNVNITYQDFYDELSPYGEWIDYPEYGYVWVPSAGPDFQPYRSSGHWVYSDDYEWMWVSDYEWGWAPFHYGRWFSDPNYGWMWMPGYEWAPAWVAWRDGGDYYGWAPLRPGINISLNFNIGSYNPPSDYWCFAPRRYISSPRIYNYCMPRSQNVTIINNTTIINNYSRRTNNTFVTGPRRHDAERYAGRINPVRFRESNSPGRSRVRNNEVSIYRPNINRDGNRNFAPRNSGQYDRNNNRNGSNVLRRAEPLDRQLRRDRNNNNGNNPIANNDNRTSDRRNRVIDRNDNTRGNNPLENRDGNRRNRVTDRNNNNGGNNPLENRNDDRRVRRQENPQVTNPIDRSRDRRQNDNPVIGRDRTREQPQTQPSRGFDRRVIEPRQDNSNRQLDRRVFERRPEATPRRQESPQAQPQRQAQPRQFESRGGGQGGGDRGDRGAQGGGDRRGGRNR